MGFIPFSDDPVEYIDKDTGVTYLLKQQDDETEMALIDIKNRYSGALKTQEEKGVRNFVNDTVNAILLGWKSDAVKLPPFPSTGNPAKQIPTPLKMAIMNAWKNTGNFSKEELKK